MASPTPRSRSNRRQESIQPAQRKQPAPGNPPDAVDPVWLLKAIGVTILAAFICGYLTLCLLFYQGQWQLVLHPSRATPAPASIPGASFQTVHFGIDETATPQLAGWLIPAAPSARYDAYTVLYLPSGDGSIADAVSTFAALHEVGINIFAFDYRGYGQSAPTRPNQKRMTEDAASAWNYLTVSRALPPTKIVLYGSGVGAALASQLAAAHPEAQALLLESPRPDLVKLAMADPRVRSLPVRALFDQNFDIAGPISGLKTPKLFLLNDNVQSPDASAAGIQRLTSVAATPKMISVLRSADFGSPLYREQLDRFLGQYLK